MNWILHFFTLAGMMAFSYLATAQSKFNIDSLTTYYEKYTGVDTTKVNMLIKLANHYNATNTTKSAMYIDQAVKLAAALNLPTVTAKVIFAKAQQLMAMGLTVDAIVEYQKAQLLYEQVGDTKGIGLCYLQIGGANIFVNRNKAIDFLQRSLTIFEKLNSKAELASATRLLGVAYRQGGLDNKKSLDYLERALKLYDELNLQDESAVVYNSIGNFHLGESNYLQALDAFQKTLDIHTKMGNLKLMALAYNGIGRVHIGLSDDHKAIEYLEKGLELNEKVGNKASMANSLTYLGISYNNIGEYDKAIGFFERGLAINKEIKNEPNMANSYVNMAAMYKQHKNYLKSYEAAQAALNILKKTAGKRECVSLLLTIGTLYNEMSDEELLKVGISPDSKYLKALEKLNEGQKISQELGELTFLADAFQKLSATYEKMNDYSKAYEAYKNYVIFKDSISGDEIKKQITRKEIQYEFDKKETALLFEKQLTIEQLEKQKLLTIQQQQSLKLKEKDLQLNIREKDLQHFAYLKEKAEKQEKEEALILSEKDKQLQASELSTLVKDKALQLESLAKKNALIAFLLSGLAAFILGGFAWYYRNRQTQLKKEAMLHNQFTQQFLQNTEQERLRIANDLHDGISHELLSLKNSLSTDIKELGSRFDEIIQEIRTISRNLHPVLFEKVGLKISLEQLIERIQESDKMFVSHEINYEKSLPMEKEMQIFRIVQEALNNTIKYSGAKAARVSLQQNEGQLLLEIKDNGKGFNVADTLESGKSFGLFSILERSKAIGGKASFNSSDAGTIVTVDIPLKNQIA